MTDLTIERMTPPTIPKPDKPYVLISLCFLGVPCRYHAKLTKMGHELFKKKLVMELAQKYTLLPLCGEQLGGLPTPRDACAVIDGKVVDRNTGTKDYTKEYNQGAQEILRLCRMFQVERAYLLKDSPMCGRGYGVLADLLEENDIMVFKE